MHGLALVIAVAQLPKVLGVKSEGETTLDQAVSLVQRLGDTNPVSLAIGGGCFAVILLCRRYLRRVPELSSALLVSGLIVGLVGADRLGVAVVGHIPTGLPALSLPVLTLADFEDLLPIALVTAMLSFSDTMVTARAFAARNGYRIDANQELIGIGMANLASGVTQSLPISASDLAYGSCRSLRWSYSGHLHRRRSRRGLCHAVAGGPASLSPLGGIGWRVDGLGLDTLRLRRVPAALAFPRASASPPRW